MEPIRLAVLPLVDAKGLQDQLKTKGIDLVLNHNDQTCTRGCTVTVEVLGYEKDVEVIAKTYQENYQKLTDGHEVNWEVANSVFDSSQESATCPACGHGFSTTLSECPDCGLVIG